MRIASILGSGISTLVSAALLFVALASAAPSSAQRLVADINQNPVAKPFAEPGEAVALGGQLIFVATTVAEGEELWISDGSAGGTRLLKDIHPGPPSSKPEDLVVFGDFVYFCAFSYGHGEELWRTDGTPEGTELVGDVAPGDTSGYPSEITPSGDLLFFSCRDQFADAELCVFDGSSITILEIVPNYDTWDLENLTAIDGERVCFSALTNEGYEPWCSNGTPEGTEMLADLWPNVASSFPTEFVSTGPDEILVAARMQGAGAELVRIDLESHDTTLYDLEPGSDSSGPSHLRVVDGGVYFTVFTQSIGRELAWYDIATKQVSLIDLIEGPPSGLPPNGVDLSLVTHGTRLFFTGDNGSTGYEVYTTDQTGNGSVELLADIQSGPGSSNPKDLVIDAPYLFMSADNGSDGIEPWAVEIDGPAFQLGDIESGPASSEPLPVYALGQGKLFFFASSGGVPGNLFYYSSGAQRISPGRLESSSEISSLTAASDRLYFSATDGDVYGDEPWIYTPAEGARLMADVRVGPQGSYPRHFTALDGYALFSTWTSAIDDEPYLWDGIGVEVIDLAAGDSAPQAPFFTVGHRFLLEATNSSGHDTLWSLDPSAPSFEEYFPGVVVPAGELAFLIEDQTHRLFITDGSAGGTTLLATFPDEATGVALREVGGASAASAEPGGESGAAPLAVFAVGASELWVSDGTVGGTEQISATWGEALTEPLVLSGSRALQVRQTAGRAELFVTDGSEDGSFQVTDRSSDSRFLYTPSVLGAIGGGWVYSDRRSDVGIELWFTDGVGESVLIDLSSGPTHSIPQAIGPLGDLFVVLATTSESGREFWGTDGTVGGTRVLFELHPGAGSEVLDPESTAILGEALYFSAIGPGGDGHELWVWREGEFFFDGFESGDTSAWTSTTP